MFKRLVVSIALIIFICMSINLNNVEATSKVMWGKTELKLGQIGKVTIKSSTVLFKMGKDNSLVKVRNLKAGEEFRVYSFKNNNGGLYGLGGGNFIQKNLSTMYETPSKSKIASLKDVSGGLSPKKGMKLTYSPTFTPKGHNEFTTTANSYGGTGVSLEHDGIIGGYSYWEDKKRFGMFVNETDWVLFDFEYPFIEGKKAKEYYIDNYQYVYKYVDVVSTTSTVTVKAGTFNNVVIIRSSNSKYYFAPGYGVIKIEDSKGKITTELVDFDLLKNIKESPLGGDWNWKWDLSLAKESKAKILSNLEIESDLPYFSETLDIYYNDNTLAKKQVPLVSITKISVKDWGKYDLDSWIGPHARRVQSGDWIYKWSLPGEHPYEVYGMSSKEAKEYTRIFDELYRKLEEMEKEENNK